MGCHSHTRWSGQRAWLSRSITQSAIGRDEMYTMWRIGLVLRSSIVPAIVLRRRLEAMVRSESKTGRAPQLYLRISIWLLGRGRLLISVTTVRLGGPVALRTARALEPGRALKEKPWYLRVWARRILLLRWRRAVAAWVSRRSWVARHHSLSRAEAGG